MPSNEKELIEDLSLIQEIQAGKNEEKNLRYLVDRYSGIYYMMAHRYFPSGSWNDGSILNDRDFVFGSSTVIILDAAKKYDPTRGAKFSTHVGNQARWFCLNFINKSRNADLDQYHGNLDLTDPRDDEELQNQVNMEIAAKIIAEIAKMKDDRLSKIFSMRYLESKGKRLTPWSKIHKHIAHRNDPDKCVSIQRCIDMHNAAVAKVRRSMKKYS
jgi:DNA-directed RNA polymerase specialized sigma subunit